MAGKLVDINGLWQINDPGELLKLARGVLQDPTYEKEYVFVPLFDHFNQKIHHNEFEKAVDALCSPEITTILLSSRN
jgi:hypothetical protein